MASGRVSGIVCGPKRDRHEPLKHIRFWQGRTLTFTPHEDAGHIPKGWGRPSPGLDTQYRC
jgi:hypothetical protein